MPTDAIRKKWAARVTGGGDVLARAALPAQGPTHHWMMSLAAMGGGKPLPAENLYLEIGNAVAVDVAGQYAIGVTQLTGDIVGMPNYQ